MLLEMAIDKDSELEADKYEYILKQQYAYLREHKLATIDYFQTIQKKNKDDTFKRIVAKFSA